MSLWRFVEKGAEVYARFFAVFGGMEPVLRAHGRAKADGRESRRDDRK